MQFVNWRPELLVGAFLFGCGGAAITPGDGGAADAPVLHLIIDGGAGVDASVASSARTISGFMGVNGFIDDPIDKLAPLGVVREYHNWGWIADNYASGPAYPDMLYTFMNFNGWDWDVFFAGLKSAGASGFPAVQGGVPWIDNSAVPPIAAGADKTAAASYIAHGDAMFQITARYGSTAVPDGMLKLQPDQTRSSGLATVSYFEDFNEPDQDPDFTSDAFAAMMSADYDGDQGRLGAGIGVKVADPNAKLVMGGLSGVLGSGDTWVNSITSFLDGIQTWANANRGGSFPGDVINVHYYSFGPGAPVAAPSPEDDGVQQKLATIVAYRDAHLPGKEVWWTEFGYDTFDQSPLHAPPLGDNSAEIVQGQWLIRDLLAAAAAGIDRATLFVLRDDCVPGASGCDASIQFSTCGVTAPKDDWTPKPAWYFLSTLRSRLGTMVYDSESTSQVADVRVQRYRDTAGGGGALVVWSPTSAATVVTGFSLSVGSATTATVVSLADQQPNGVAASPAVSGGAITLDVSETPTIVLVDAI